MPKRGTGTESFKSGLPCKFDGCDALRFSRGWCSMHYYRWKKFGDPVFTPKPRPRNGQGKGQRIEGIYQPPYRLAYYREHGELPPKGHHVHHKDHNHANDEPKNLQALSAAEHQRHHRTKWPEYCKVEGCPSKVLRSGGCGFGYCKRHYNQMKTHSHILSVTPIPRSDRFKIRRPQKQSP